MSSRTVTFLGFALIVGAAAVWQVVAIIGPHRATIGQMQRWVMGSLGARIALFAFWAWLGLHLFARGKG
jgi:hypothetical protein